MGMMKIVPAVAAAVLLAGCVTYPGGGGYYGGHSSSNRYPGGSYGQGGYGQGGYGQGNQGSGVVRCESQSERTRRCNANTRGGVTLTRQLSRTQCVQGRNWGWDNTGIWVSQGCRAEFVTGRGGGYGGSYPGNSRPGNPGNQARTIRCESQSNRHRRCDVQVRRDVQLGRQLSDTRCVRGQNWNWDRNGIWVDRGCRAEFVVR